MPKITEFDGLINDMFNYFLVRDPILATYLGIHDFDGILPKVSKDDYVRDIDSKEKYLSKFLLFKNYDLDKEQELDRDLAIYGLKLDIFSSKSLRFWESLPNCANIIGNSLFPLFTKEFTSFEKRLASIIKRIENAPNLINETKSRINKPIKIWIETEIESLNNLPIFLDNIISRTQSEQLSSDKLKSVVDELKNSLKDFKEWIISEKLPNSGENFAIGTENFEHLLRLRGFKMNSEKILEFGVLSLKKEKKRLNEVSKQIDPSKSVSEIKVRIDSDHKSTFSESLALIRKTVKEAKEFVEKNKFAKIPINEDLIVMETPLYLRNIIPFAAYFSPAKFESMKIGIYITTIPDKENLSELSCASISNTVVHEAYPGHHLQLTYNTLHHSLIRTLFQGPEFIEGWAHYCEEAMKEIGWRDNLETRFIQYLDLIWRAARIIIDIKLSTGRMSFDQAIQFLIKETGMIRKSAIAEIRRYTYSPGYQLSYYLGKHLINNLKEEMKKIWGVKYSDYFFHNKVLESGGLPIFLMKKAIS